MPKSFTKSFKEIYEQDKNTSKKSATEPTDKNISIIAKGGSTVEPVTLERPSPTMTVLDSGLPETNTKTPMPPVKEPLTEEIKDVLTEHQEQSAMVLESVMKTNIKIKNSVAKMIKSNTESNKKLVNDITRLMEKVKKLETRLSELQNLEVSAPIIDPRSPTTKIIKKVHRDENGLITHISETRTIEDEDE